MLQAMTSAHLAMAMGADGKTQALRWTQKPDEVNVFTAAIAEEGIAGHAICVVPIQEETFALVFPVPAVSAVVEIVGVTFPPDQRYGTYDGSSSAENYEKVRGLCLAKGADWDVLKLDEAFEVDGDWLDSWNYPSLKAGVTSSLYQNAMARAGDRFVYRRPGGGWSESSMYQTSEGSKIGIYGGSTGWSHAVACMRKSVGETETPEGEPPVTEVRSIQIAEYLHTSKQFDSAVAVCGALGNGWDILKFDEAFETSELLTDAERAGDYYVSWIPAYLKQGVYDSGVLTWNRSLMKDQRGEYAMRSIAGPVPLYQFTNMDSGSANSVSCMKRSDRH